MQLLYSHRCFKYPLVISQNQSFTTKRIEQLLHLHNNNLIIGQVSIIFKEAYYFATDTVKPGCNKV